MPKKLFISYRRANWSFTQWLSQELGKLIDAEIFIDFSGIDESNFEKSLLRNLRESDAVLLIVTEHTFAPDRIFHPEDWVRREIRESLAMDKPIALALYEGKTPPSDPTKLPDDIVGIQKVQGIDFYSRYFKAGVHELANFLQRVSPIEMLDANMPVASQIDDVPRNTPKSKLDAATSLAEAGDYKRALALLTALQTDGYKSRFFKIADIIQDVQAAQNQEQRRWEAGEAYDEIEMFSRINLKRAHAAWQAFKAEYPEWQDDPAHLVERFQALSNVPFKEKQTAPIEEEIDSLLGASQFKINMIRSNSEPPPPSIEDFSKQVQSILGAPFAWCDVPAGNFLMGTDRTKDDQAHNAEPDIHERYLDGFWMAKYPITYSQFQVFIEANDGIQDDRWWQGLAKSYQSPYEQQWPIADHPRENVDWYQSMAFCRWLSHRLGGGYDVGKIDQWLIRLPTEAEWEKAARGTDGRIYPYGDQVDQYKSNIDESGVGKTTPVTAYPEGASPYGVLDMSGNVWEWCLNNWTYPYQHSEVAKMDISNNLIRVLRGGSWGYYSRRARAAYRYYLQPDGRLDSFGFRVVCRPPSLDGTLDSGGR